MKKLILVFVSVSVLALGACNENTDPQATSSYESGGMRAEKMAVAADMMAAPMQAAPPSSMAMDRSTMGDRKIAETHNLDIETSYDALQARYQRDFKKCVELGCQIINSNIVNEQGGNINARITPEKLPEFLDFLATGEGRIRSHAVSADDYTMEYSDTVSQTENLMALRERLRTLLNSNAARDVDSILSIESELNRVQTEIDQRTARLKILQKMTQMATVDISYSVQYRPAEIRAYELKNTWKYTANRFMQNVDSMIQYVGGILPWIPVWFVGFWLAVRAIRFAVGKISIKWPWKK